VDTSAYVLFCAGPIVSAAVGTILARKVAAVAGVVEEVKHQTNGIATAQTASIQAHLTEQDITAGEVALAAEKRAVRPTEGAPGSDLPADDQGEGR
jgi:hypothetical protein